MKSDIDYSIYTLPSNTPVFQLNCAAAFSDLSNQEKKYAHCLSQACWKGSLICLFQTSPESPGIFLLIHDMFKLQDPTTLKNASGAKDSDFDDFLVYCAGFLYNMGNYKGFGDTKFIPKIDKEIFLKICSSSEAFAKIPEFESRLKLLINPIYSLQDNLRQLGFPDKNQTTYFSPSCTENDVKAAQEFLDSHNISPYNTRLFKCGDTPVIKVASQEERSDVEMKSDKGRYRISYGDYHQILRAVNEHLQAAQQYAANDHEISMLKDYIRSFKEGSIEAHKDGSRHWIKDKGPAVETYIGFIESYRDPYGTRGEFEGFVAIVNRASSKKFGELVNNAEKFLNLLPWGTAFEKDKFLQPDFTSLDIITFGCTGIPLGINIPNYDDVRQNDGFKNVSLGNVLSCVSPSEKITFLPLEDQKIYIDWRSRAFEVQVGLHELLGHGSGKLFVEAADSSVNFDKESTLNPITNDKIHQWYKHGESWDSKFAAISSPYEECRAECVGLLLCLENDVQSIFGFTGEDAGLSIYANWLCMVRSGLLSLEYYSPEQKKWRQAHCQARFVILQVLLEAGNGLLSLEKCVDKDGNNDLVLRLNRDLIYTVGKQAINDFLLKLQVYKTLGDIEGGSLLFSKYSAVSQLFSDYREIVMANKQPRKLLVLGNTFLSSNGSVEFKEYDPSPSGLITSFTERFADCADLMEEVNNLWRTELSIFPLCS